MVAEALWLKPLGEVGSEDQREVGAKAGRLAVLAKQGYPVAPGFCLTAAAYHHFVRAGRLRERIRVELGRKPAAQMRWEEVWDAALRIRNAFLTAAMPAELETAILECAASTLPAATRIVRSSALGEDSAERSFAGVHESVLGVRGDAALLGAIRRVWASLWSDAALRYAGDEPLDPERAAMAVLVQEQRGSSPSGVAFGRDPTSSDDNRLVVEAVAGGCDHLVDGVVDPDRWVIARDSGAVLAHRVGESPREPGTALLDDADLAGLRDWLRDLETRCGWPPDIEWTGGLAARTLLQVRPITTLPAEGSGEDLQALRPSPARLRELRSLVVDELIPELEATGRRFAAEKLEDLDDRALAAAIRERQATLAHWRSEYDRAFIPFAHGVRALGAYYADALRPADPYEFVGLLSGQPMLASARNAALAALAEGLADDASLRAGLESALAKVDPSAEGGAKPLSWNELRLLAERDESLLAYLRSAEEVARANFDVAYDGQRMDDRPRDLLHMVIELAHPEAQAMRRRLRGGGEDESRAVELEARLLDAVGAERADEARERIEIGRQAWRLRDDDNILLARVEAELLRAVTEAAGRLQRAGRLAAGRVGEAAADALAEALLGGGQARVDLGDAAAWVASDRARGSDSMPHFLPSAATRARQLVGQPAAPGVATGAARLVRGAEDLARFCAGEILVCDALQPMMTHIVPLAAAVVERRGGMLIHGSIIARELGLPCVNGIPAATESIADGEEVTVDGYLGIVTIGPPTLPD